MACHDSRSHQPSLPPRRSQGEVVASRPGRGVVLVDRGAVIVHVGVELHVARPGHRVTPEDLLYAAPQVTPDLIQVVILLDGLTSRRLCSGHFGDWVVSQGHKLNREPITSTGRHKLIRIQKRDVNCDIYLDKCSGGVSFFALFLVWRITMWHKSDH